MLQDIRSMEFYYKNNMHIKAARILGCRNLLANQLRITIQPME